MTSEDLSQLGVKNYGIYNSSDDDRVVTIPLKGRGNSESVPRRKANISYIN